MWHRAVWMHPQVKWLHEHGIDADVIVGAKTKDLIILDIEILHWNVIGVFLVSI